MTSSKEPSPAPKSQQLLICLMLFLVAVSIHSSAIWLDFTNWDDQVYVTGNTLLQNLTWSNLAHVWSPFLVEGKPFPEYHPFRDMAIMMLNSLGQGSPLSFHLFNVLVHGVNTVLVYFCLFGLFGSMPPALVTASIFAFHPAHVESVAWISSIKDVLGLFFTLLSIIGFVRAFRTASKASLRWSILWFIFALLSKSHAITLPILFAVFVVWEKRETDRLGKVLWPTLPYFGIALVYGLWVQYLQSLTLSAGDLYAKGFTPDPVAIIKTFGIYTFNTLLPILLSPYHDVDATIHRADWLFSAGALVTIALGVIIVRGWRTRNPIALSLLIYVIQILPVLNLLPHPIWVADRYLYFFAPFLWWPVVQFAYAGRPDFRPVAGALWLALITLFAWMTVTQIPDWRNDITLGQAVLRHYPQSVTGRFFLATGLQNAGSLKEALQIYDQMLSIDPKNEHALFNIGTINLQMNRPDNARISLEKALKLHPERFEINYQLGKANLRIGRLKEAIEHYQTASRISPERQEAWFDLGLAYARQGRLTEAKRTWSRVVSLDPLNEEAYYDLAVVSARLGLTEEARSAALRYVDVCRECRYRKAAGAIADLKNQ